MEYIIFDLEFNQGFNRVLNKTISDEKCPFEILQIGAIKLDSNFNIIDTFDSFVKPKIYKSIHPYVGKMTNISIHDVINAPTFPYVYKDFKKFISSNKKTTFCVWGTSDLKELYRNIVYYGLSSKNLPKSYIDVQSYASKHFKSPSGKSIGLQRAIDNLNLNDSRPFHNALNDAYYTSQVFINIHNPSIVSSMYSYNTIKSKPSRKSKLVVDFEAVYREFEQTLGRSLTNDDKKLIKIAYNMGKSNKFTSEFLESNYKKR